MLWECATGHLSDSFLSKRVNTMHGFSLLAHDWFGVFLFGLRSAKVSNGLCGYQNTIKTLIKKSCFLDWFVFCISHMNAAANAQIKCHKCIPILVF